MVNTSPELPPADSPNLTLLHPTPQEKLATWTLNGQAWRGSMDISTYLRREAYLENQDFTTSGGITFWILVDATLPPDARPILSSCESLRKRAVIARTNGEMAEITSHGIASVFCNPKYRRRGYTQRMITELGKKLDNWQQKDGERANFTVLYSDIGKVFYSRLGWYPFLSSHIALPSISSQETPMKTRYLLADDLPELCALDEKWLKKEIRGLESPDPKILVALIPDIETIQWHHAREDFAGKEILGRDPQFKGAYAKTEEGDQVWCIWTRTYGNDQEGNVLHVLRFVIEGDQLARSGGEKNITPITPNQARIQAAAAVLRAAQIEAAKWDMKIVQLWNPTPMTVLAAREIEPSIQIVYRDEESIASLRWHGIDPEDRSKVEWIGNEKFGWC